MSNHANISIFVPNLGCKHRCSFCNQFHITGSTSAPTPQDVISAVNIAKISKNYDPASTEIAFFGGSFTCIPKKYMLSLLDTAHLFVKSNEVSGIRISTRPDAVDDETLEVLCKYGVTSVELGAQSLDDAVLKVNFRGHTAEDVYVACKNIRKFGLSLGLQMMTGLYGSSEKSDLETAKKIIDLNPDTLRIYPTVLLKDTYLYELYKRGEYQPQTVEEAADLCSEIIQYLQKTNIKLIRLGLHTIEKDSFVAGPFHPAFSEICKSKVFLDLALKQLKEKGDYNIYVNPSCLSQMIGQRKENIKQLLSYGYNCKVKSANNLNEFQITVERCDA